MPSDGYFGATIAADYDRDHAASDPSQAVMVLSDLAGKAPALEFAIGTGRVALSLAACGVEVHGIELSQAMVARMRAKPGGRISPSPSGTWRRRRSKGLLVWSSSSSTRSTT